MSVKQKYTIGIAAAFGLLFALYQLYPLILFHVLEWQKSFNSQLSTALRTIHDNTQQAGASLLLISFLYGIFHAVGPGHGKFILTSYLSLEQTKLPQTLKITWLSAIVQGLVAVGLVTLLVVGAYPFPPLFQSHTKMGRTWQFCRDDRLWGILDLASGQKPFAKKSEKTTACDPPHSPDFCDVASNKRAYSHRKLQLRTQTFAEFARNGTDPRLEIKVGSGIQYRATPLHRGNFSVVFILYSRSLSLGRGIRVGDGDRHRANAQPVCLFGDVRP